MAEERGAGLNGVLLAEALQLGQEITQGPRVSEYRRPVHWLLKDKVN